MNTDIFQLIKIKPFTQLSRNFASTIHTKDKSVQCQGSATGF
jgi:hypothetical protein